MKSLSLSKPLVIAIVGLPGAGKSFFAEQFAETFGAPLVSYDRIRRTLFPESAFDKAEEELISKIAGEQLQQVLKTKQTVALDGTGHARVERMKLAKQARDQGYALLIVWVQTDEATTRARATKSRRNESLFTPLTPEQYDTLSRQFTPPNHSESYIVISGKHTYPAQVKVVLKKLAQPRQEAGPATPPQRAPTTPRRQNITIR